MMYYLIILLSGLIGFMVPMILANIYANKRRRVQKIILDKNKPTQRDGIWFPIRYSSECRFNNWWKFMPWDMYGMLYIGPNMIVLYRHSDTTEPVQLEFPKKEVTKKWVGRTIKNGLVSWFRLEYHGIKHYFTSETGTTILGSEPTTELIYQNINVNTSI